MEITDWGQITKRNLVPLQSLKRNQAVLSIINRIKAFFLQISPYNQNFSFSRIHSPSFQEISRLRSGITYKNYQYLRVLRRHLITDNEKYRRIFVVILTQCSNCIKQCNQYNAQIRGSKNMFYFPNSPKCYDPPPAPKAFLRY